MSWLMVDKPADLASLCERLKGAGLFGLDMEFRREKTYYAELELVQVATDDEVVIVDPLALDDLGPLFELVADPSVEKVLHAGTQDLEIVNDLSGAIPDNVFDTQIAAALLGFGDQTRYEILVRQALGVSLPKLQSTSDWSRRPLNERQIAYALDDVRHLPALRRALGERLEERGRTSWAVEEMAKLSDPSTYERDPDDLTRGLKGRGRLDPTQLAALRELAMWREELAQRKNRPRRWMVPDDVLIGLARRMPEKAEDLGDLRRLSDNLAGREAEGILAAVRRAKEVPADDRPSIRGRTKEDSVVERISDMLDVYVRQRADETGVAVPYLATRRDLVELIRAVRRGVDPDRLPKLLRGWRKELVGDALVELARGRRALHVDPATGRVDAVPTEP